MREYELSGVFLQRFTPGLNNPAVLGFRDAVARNVRAAAESNGRVFALMYDISGQPRETVVETVKRDWVRVVDTLRLIDSPQYLRYNGRPLLAIWGFGFTDRSPTPSQAAELIDFFKNHPDSRYQVTLLGVPTENPVYLVAIELTGLCWWRAPVICESVAVVLAAIRSSLRSQAELEAEILALRHQLAVRQQAAPRRLRLTRADRLFWLLRRGRQSEKAAYARAGQCLANSSPNTVEQQDPIRATGRRTCESKHLRYALQKPLSIIRKASG
jgi:hypothetical protein